MTEFFFIDHLIKNAIKNEIKKLKSFLKEMHEERNKLFEDYNEQQLEIIRLRKELESQKRFHEHECAEIKRKFIENQK
jgi:hypothetical protein